MDYTKVLVVGILFIVAGIIFTGTGMYFLSSGYLAKLQDARSTKDMKKRRESLVLGKASGYFADIFGIFTVLCGITMIVCPAAVQVLIIVYLSILFLAALVIAGIVKKFSR